MTAVHDVVNIRRNVRVPTKDPDVTLSAELFLPPAPAPVLLMATGFRNDLAVGWESTLRWFALRGYACVLANLRGTGASDGTERPRLDPGEGEDLLALIDWAAHEPWSTGDVGMWGVSYGGAMALRAASLEPAALKAIMPIVCSPDPERYNGARSDFGMLVHRGGLGLLDQLVPPLTENTSEQAQRRWRARLDDEPFLMDLARSAAGSPTWRERAFDPAAISVPAFCVGGWHDLFSGVMTRVYDQLQGPKKLLVGPWMHSMPNDARSNPIDFLLIALRWWDHWLRGKDTGVLDEPPVALYVEGHAPGWRSYESWPPTKEEIVLTGMHDASLQEGSQDTTQPGHVLGEYQPDPTIGALSGLWGYGNVFDAVLDQHDDEARSLSFTTKPFEAPVLVCGDPSVSVRLSSTDWTPRLVVKLSVVDHQGRSTLLTTGIACPHGEADSVSVLLRSIAYRVPAGHRLRLSLSDSDFPLLTPLPDPTPFTLAELCLELPIAEEDHGADVAVSALPDKRSTTDCESWTISRDALHDGIEVVLAWGKPLIRTAEGHRYTRHSDTRAAVRRAYPAAATASGIHTATVHLATGEVIEARATVRASQTALWARGELTIDGHSIFARTWETTLSPSV
ncbi:CocE/NonD family hydrolase [Amycolatopsis pithecellobii]|uniref:CocE/NonD family hydrolase n=1 Tax=Amycolatopsis pithecellobii TaxID=664692 RepID=A0A6N7YZ46_9PSEU|nr:CocE/NonD family hydrolase [Amycolatopsis pithecellobii]MTD52731.1 CocE/NonD family hydrolase [Amycolatopsis pithecellobii]